MSFRTYYMNERPDLRQQAKQIDEYVWPDFITYDGASLRFWSRLFTDFPNFQFVLADESDQVVGAGYTAPLYWDGTLPNLPAGWDGALEVAFSQTLSEYAPNTLCALSAVVSRSMQGRGVSYEIIRAMQELAEANNYSHLIAPVRPTLKPTYVLTPIERYIQWKRSDGLPFDPWLRVHSRLGAEILQLAPKSMNIVGSVDDWENWTQMSFPESGLYVVPGALVPIYMNRTSNTGIYEEPNLWMRHSIRAHLQTSPGG